MLHSETIKSILPALLKTQSELNDIVITKNAKNPHFKNKYADLNHIIETIFPVLNQNKLVLFQPILETEKGAFVESIIFHESGEWVKCEMELRVSKNDMQGYGSALTYARRYTLTALLSLTAQDDDGNKSSFIDNENNYKPEIKPDNKPYTKPDNKPKPENKSKFNLTEVEKDFNSAQTFDILKKYYDSALELYPDNQKEVFDAKERAKKALTEKIANEALQEIKA